MLASISLLITGIGVLIFDVATNRPAAAVVGVSLLAVLVGLLVVVPVLVRRGSEASAGDSIP